MAFLEALTDQVTLLLCEDLYINFAGCSALCHGSGHVHERDLQA